MTKAEWLGKLRQMSHRKSILFVCTGNTCRSPLAEGFFRQAVAERDDFEVASAGLAACPGGKMSEESAALLRARGVEMEEFRSQPVTPELIERATHVFAMTQGHLDSLEQMFPEFEDKLFLVCEFSESVNGGLGGDVPDPIGGGVAAYEEVAATLDRAIPSLVQYIDQTTQDR